MDMLLRSGREGMNVRRLVRQIYNLHSGIFSSDVVYSQLYDQVRGYLWRQSRQRYSPIVRLRWGRYALKPDIAVQLDIFIDMPSDKGDERHEQRKEHEDKRQLTLFNS